MTCLSLNGQIYHPLQNLSNIKEEGVEWTRGDGQQNARQDVNVETHDFTEILLVIVVRAKQHWTHQYLTLDKEWCQCGTSLTDYWKLLVAAKESIILISF